MKTVRNIIIGDVHGCLQELDELLKLISYCPNDNLVFVGDLVDRGPNSAGVVARVMELNAISVMGNHDEWYVRFAKREAEGSNKMKKHPWKMDVYNSLNKDQLEWLSKLPLTYKLEKNWTIVHAGFLPNVAIEDQPANVCLRLRYVDIANNKMWGKDDGRLLLPGVAAYWSELWNGSSNIVYGHHPSKTDTIVTSNGLVKCYGIDTGCCFGNKLTALIKIDNNIELVSVNAKEQYTNWHYSMKD